MSIERHLELVDRIIDLDIEININLEKFLEEKDSELEREYNKTTDDYIRLLGISKWQPFFDRDAWLETKYGHLRNKKNLTESEKENLEELERSTNEVLYAFLKHFASIDADSNKSISSVLTFGMLKYVSQLWKIVSKNELLAYNFGKPTDFDYPTLEQLRARALHQKEILSKEPEKIHFSNLKELFLKVLEEEKNNEAILLVNLPLLGIRRPPAYCSCYRMDGKNESDEQKLMEAILGFSPPFY